VETTALVAYATLVLLFLYTVSAIVVAVLNRSILHGQRRLVRAQTAPQVILYPAADPERETVIQLVAKNVGAAMAYDVRFEFSRPVPRRAWGLDARTAEEVPPMADGPLVDGIPTLAPGESRRLDWGQFSGLKRNLGDEPIHATVRFTDGAEEMPATRAVLEVDSFTGTPANATHLATIARAAEQIAEVARRFKWGPIQVQVQPPPTPKKEDEEAA
jgi:hypothetical protein